MLLEKYVYCQASLSSSNSTVQSISFSGKISSKVERHKTRSQGRIRRWLCYKFDTKYFFINQGFAEILTGVAKIF